MGRINCKLVGEREFGKEMYVYGDIGDAIKNIIATIYDFMKEKFHHYTYDTKATA